MITHITYLVNKNKINTPRSKKKKKSDIRSGE